jgi:hypothetical protein
MEEDFKNKTRKSKLAYPYHTCHGCYTSAISGAYKMLRDYPQKDDRVFGKIRL